MLFLTVLSCFLVVVVAKSKPPKWPDCYTAYGTLRLPYAELSEPFTAYFEAKKNRSRIDYYGKCVFSYFCAKIMS